MNSKILGFALMLAMIAGLTLCRILSAQPEGQQPEKVLVRVFVKALEIELTTGRQTILTSPRLYVRDGETGKVQTEDKTSTFKVQATPRILNKDHLQLGINVGLSRLEGSTWQTGTLIEMEDGEATVGGTVTTESHPEGKPPVRVMTLLLVSAMRVKG